MFLKECKYIRKGKAGITYDVRFSSDETDESDKEQIKHHNMGLFFKSMYVKVF